jgi:hypothetical protein
MVVQRQPELAQLIDPVGTGQADRLDVHVLLRLSYSSGP